MPEIKYPCKNCQHTHWNHKGKTGACLEQNCDCEKYENAAEMPDYDDWKRAQPVEVAIQIDAGEGRVFDSTFTSLDDLEYDLCKMERSIEQQLREEYDTIVQEAEDEDGV